MSDVRKGVYILPNLFTTLSLFFGFYAIVQAIKLAMSGGQNFEICAVAIVAAAICDGLDGRVARRTRTSSRFGTEYDSLADLVSFGVAPAVTMYVWALRDFPSLGWPACFVYLTCGALRLARFNVQAGNVEKKFFQGLPIPMAAMMLAGTILIWEGRPVGDKGLFVAGDIQWFLLIFTYLLAGLMVSAIPFRSFKTLHLTQRRPFYTLVLVPLGLVIWYTKPWWVLFLLGCGYLLSGPVERYVIPPPVQAYRRARRRRRMKKALERIDDLASAPPTAQAPDSGEDAAGENVHPIRKP
ncbi:MAG: CDP-diacylglycerol--serine O-phosphatidyltransferase [Pseudomonadota bacterium]